MAVRHKGHPDVALGEDLTAVQARPDGAPFQANASLLAAHEEDTGEAGSAQICTNDQGARYQGLYAVLRHAEPVQWIQVFVRVASEWNLSDAMVC